jgi:hypothetical protein
VDKKIIMSCSLKKIFNKFGYSQRIAVLINLEDWEWIFLGEWISNNRKDYLYEFLRVWESICSGVTKDKDCLFNSLELANKLQCRHSDLHTFIKKNFISDQDIIINLPNETRLIKFTERGLVRVLTKYRNADLEFIEEIIGRKLIG